MSDIPTSDLMYRLLVQGVKDHAIYLLNADGVVMNWNVGAQRAKGYSAEEIVGQNYEVFYDLADRAKNIPQKNLEIARRTGHLTTEGWRLRKDRTRFWASVAIDPLYDDQQRFLGFAKITRDRTEQRAAEQRLLHQAHHDHLTQLPNRIAFAEAVEDILPKIWYGAGFALHYIDLDRFKPVNDSFGHEMGDALLRQVADRLRTVVGKDDLVSRFGGDEFAVLQNSCSSRQEASAAAERIIDALCQPFQIGRTTAIIGASVGIAYAPDDGASIIELLRNADLALYDAKSAGRGRHRHYSEALSDRAVCRRVLELKLRHAVNARQFTLHYQPVIDVAAGTTTAYEALLRWNDHDGKAISPAEFIPLAEDLDLMGEIGTWVLRQACRDACTWSHGETAAVNVSVVQLRDPGFVETVRSALKDSGLPANRFELEITETAVLQNIRQASETLSEIRRMGVSIALDDFGTGFSSLSLVQQLPLTRIKIDRSFVTSIDDTPQSTAVIRSVLSLCEGLGLATTAEGVETEEQLKLLKLQGCRDLQGFLLGKPAPLDTWTYQHPELMTA